MNNTPDILLEIVSNRRMRIQKQGWAQGLAIPKNRRVPLVNFMDIPNTLSQDTGILIAEVKRRSPSKGNIAPIPDPAALASAYWNAGFRRISVLTEEDRFSGSLADLITVKAALPQAAILRKDFLLSLEDIDVSFRAGADAVLLIATLLHTDVLQDMYRRAVDLGLTPLVEVHTENDVDKVRTLQPALVGINSRDLRKFRVEPLLPLETRSLIDWPCHVIYESGISSSNDVLFVRGSGFSGFLVGEAIAKSPKTAEDLIKAWTKQDEAQRIYRPWERLFRRHRPGIPLVKICGITHQKDAEAALAANADIIGFVLAQSKRSVTPKFIRECADLPIIKAGIVVLKPEQALPENIVKLLEDGMLDFIQFHGHETPETVRSWPGYKAVNLGRQEDLRLIKNPGSPSVLVDAFSQNLPGGTGKRLKTELVHAVIQQRRLWLAGGLNPKNVRSIVHEFSPGLVDVSSGVCSDGDMRRKDAVLIQKFIKSAKEMQQ